MKKQKQPTVKNIKLISIGRKRLAFISLAVFVALLITGWAVTHNFILPTKERAQFAEAEQKFYAALHSLGIRDENIQKEAWCAKTREKYGNGVLGCWFSIRVTADTPTKANVDQQKFFGAFDMISGFEKGKYSDTDYRSYKYGKLACFVQKHANQENPYYEILCNANTTKPIYPMRY